MGTGVETKIRDLAALVREAVGYAGETVWDAERPDGQPVRYLDVLWARELIAFEADVPQSREPTRGWASTTSSWARSSRRCLDRWTRVERPRGDRR